MFGTREQLLQDLRYALRMMVANPLFTAMATISLALGIGANTIYSFMDAILIRALPVQQPETLIVFNWHSKAHPPVARNMNGTSYQDASTGYTSGNFPYPADHITGEIDFFTDHFVIKNMRGQHGPATLRFDGAAGGYRRDSGFAFRIEIDEMPLDDALRNALGRPISRPANTSLARTLAASVWRQPPAD